MARITHVKKAQQRYAQVVVRNEDGTPKRTPVLDSRTGQQKVSKRGPVFLTVTQADKNQPLPPLTCEACRKPIEVGTPYKHVTPKSGPYGGHQRNRHEACPTWQPWDLSNAWWARIAQATDGLLDDFEPESVEDVEAKAQEAAEAIRALAEESREAADNIEQGFGHETQQSQEASERADNLESWADEIEQVQVPDYPEDGAECEECGGTGKVENPEYSAEASEEGDPNQEDVEEEIDCDNCDGTGTLDEPTDDQIQEWRDEAIEALQSEIDNCPV